MFNDRESHRDGSAPTGTSPTRRTASRWAFSDTGRRAIGTRGFARGKVTTPQLLALTPNAYKALWSHLLNLDLVETITAYHRPPPSRSACCLPTPAGPCQVQRWPLAADTRRPDRSGTGATARRGAWCSRWPIHWDMPPAASAGGRCRRCRGDKHRRRPRPHSRRRRPGCRLPRWHQDRRPGRRWFDRGRPRGDQAADIMFGWDRPTRSPGSSDPPPG